MRRSRAATRGRRWFRRPARAVLSLRCMRARPRRPQGGGRRRPARARAVFFQADAGIRDWSVTGVQTCALPISAIETGFQQSAHEAAAGALEALARALGENGGIQETGATADRSLGKHHRRIVSSDTCGPLAEFTDRKSVV